MHKVFGVRLARLSLSAAIAILILGSAPSSSFAAGTPGRLAQIFMPQMLEAEVASLEKITGRPANVRRGPVKGFERRRYTVDGCEVEATLGLGHVRSLHLKLSDRCSFELTAFFTARQPLPTASEATFGDVERAIGRGKIVGVCLTPCGKADRPAVYEHIEGSQADNFVDAVPEVALADKASLRAAADWLKSMRDDGSEASVKGTRFNCDERYEEAAHRLFDKIRITAIRIGYNFSEAWQCD